MSVIDNVFHDGVAQANSGLYPSNNVFPKFSPIGPMTLGFLWGNIWSDCGFTATASWSGCSYVNAASWAGCSNVDTSSWGECL